MIKPTYNWITCNSACHGYLATDYSWHISKYNLIPRRNVLAPETGKVIGVGLNHPTRGKYVDLQVGDVVYEFSHFKDVGVQINKTYKEGTLIGIMGNTGQANGVHLHLVIKVKGVRVDPDPWMNARIAALAPKPEYPKTVTVTSASGANVRSKPKLSAPLSGSKSLVKGDKFTSVGLVKGDSVSGNNKWHKSNKGNYVWSGNTNVK
jgi:hypothetical protein